MMIRLTLPLMALSLAACTVTPAQQARKAEIRSLEAAVWQTRKPITVEGKRIDVAVAPDKSFALVDPHDFGPTVTKRQTEAAASAASDCTGQERSVLHVVSQTPDELVKTKIFRNTEFIRVGLVCS